MKNSTPKQRITAALSLDLARIGAAFCLIVSLAGVGIGAYLTTVKFRMTYTPFLTKHGGCGFGGMTCDDALNSPVSTLMTLPISLWGTAFYLVTGFLAAALVWRRTVFGGTAAPLLLILAGFAALTSVVLGAYAFLKLESPCPFCLTLYLVSALLLAGAYVTRNPPGVKNVPTWRDLWRDCLPSALDALFLLGVIFIVATGGQSMTYHGLRNLVDSQVGISTVAVKALPGTTLKLGDANPQAILVMFIDMACNNCRNEFKALTGALRDRKFPAPVQLWIYHTPRQACDIAAFPGGYAKSDDSVRFDNPCLAARAVECLEQLRPGSSANMLSGLFALQLDRQKDTPLFTALRIGNRAVDLDIEIDPDDAENELFRCIDHDKEVLARITAHQQYAEDPSFKVPTVAVYRVKNGAPDLTQKAWYGDANTSLETFFTYVQKQSASTKPPAR